MSNYDRKGYQPEPDNEYGIGVRALNKAGPTAPGQYDVTEDVFGNEEGAQVLT